MKRFLFCLLFLALLCALPSFGQGPAFGNITASGSACTTVGACVQLSLPYSASSISITVSGTYSATLQFEGAGDNGNFVNITAFPQPSGGTVTSTTSTGTWILPISGLAVVRVRCSAFSSGSASVTINPGGGAAWTDVASITFLPAPAQSLSGSTQTPLTGSNTGAASAANVTLAGATGKTTYITGFQITGGGATGASIITVTVTGVITGTMSYNIAVPAGATAGITPLIVSFPIPIPASTTNTAIVVNVPSFGAGNTNSAVSAQGFQQ